MNDRPVYSWTFRGGLLKIARGGDVIVSTRGLAAELLAGRLYQADWRQTDMICALLEIALKAARDGEAKLATGAPS